ncbi:protein phosphatase 1 regulatory subunit 36 [Periophthalmus magnuspinnatus]|uniref:protein phosphatase 1 regulatory subunit 36 n=1 Tax=Periophthalmus magnuspinnatus TaxID=409849 RepID=UPI002437023B|nr:protein phosphatase 1 regulatory subunit 36 [Periophthalmus magnuspinnatus]
MRAGRWEWNHEANTVDFIRLAEVYRVNRRCWSKIKTVDPALLKAYRSAVIENQGEHVTLEDVKQVAVKLLLENDSLPIPHCFLDILKSKQLDEILIAVLHYLCCFFEYNSLENKPKTLIVLDMVTEQQMKKRSSAKRELALKRLAVLYSFFCFVSWVTFGRTELKLIQEEIGRILYSDNFSAAVKTKQEVHSRRTSAVSTGSEKTRSSLHSVANSRSPLMASLLPSPREQSPHLFVGPKAAPEPLLLTPPTDPEDLTEELCQMSIGILGQPLQQFDPVTLVHENQSTHTEADQAPVSRDQAEQ